MASLLSKGLAPRSALFSALRSRSYAQSAHAHAPAPAHLQLPYFIPRNSKGSLPVYSDIRNGGTRYLVLVKNVRGNAHTLRDDIASSLFAHGSEDAAYLKADVLRADTVVVSGGRWKHQVMDWLRQRGF
ncbi:hypothetical protein DFH11DRAFT_1541565 [Phellopilus nigrolimitatus]|nr:hypothetical protein DFH11DRAFT_1541565 [Phellopilus nigrolimitatus]